MRLIAFGAHPDDCELRCGGLAAKLAALGHQVKFVSVTDGRSGHQSDYGDVLASRRRLEAAEAARRLGIAAYAVLSNPDGALEPTLANRIEVVRQIREWRADVVIAHRPNDYHADHRYTGQLVVDSAYLVQVPGVCREVPPLPFNPCYLYMWDPFKKPVPFSPDLVVDVSREWGLKVDALDAHACQFYDWLPWLDGKLGEVPKTTAERKRWLAKTYLCEAVSGSESARQCEAFEISEYGGRLHREQWEALMPFLSVRENSGCFYDQTA